MTAPAAFKATFSDFRLVKGRKVAQIVVEVPIEEADNALKALGGIPRPDLERWVAVARLSPGAGSTVAPSQKGHEGPSRATTEGEPAPAGPLTAPGETKGGWYALKPSARAALLCKEVQFQHWAAKLYGLPAPLLTSDEAAGWLRDKIGVRSRADLDVLHENPEHPAKVHSALLRFAEIERAYRIACGLETEAR